MKPQQLNVAEKAKSLLLERGWRQGWPPLGGLRIAVGPPLCMAEAIACVLEQEGSPYVLFEVDITLMGLGFFSPSSAVAWNDAPGRTFEEVLERLDTWA